MGDDSKILPKHKRRTTLHKKHSAFPGMTAATHAIIVGGSIKSPTPKFASQSNIKIITYNHPLWIIYDNAARRIGALGGSQPKAARNRAEQEYSLAFKALMKAKLVYPTKKKYLV